MKKDCLKKILSCVLFCALVASLVAGTNKVLVKKAVNRYYILEEYLEENDGEYDVQVFGSCHSYTSFYPEHFKQLTGLGSFVYGNAGEIIPTTYLRMIEQFERHTPKVALVELWGMNAYETYTESEEIFEDYMPVNVERIPFSAEKLEVIRDFDSLDFYSENLSFVKYKDRIMNMNLSEVDFCYSFDMIEPYSTKYTFTEMTERLNNYGFTEMPYWVSDTSYTPYKDISDYAQRQAMVADDEKLAFEPDMMKYVDKIIQLCEENDVQLIFYRAPYISTANELRKANWFEDYCESKGILFLDLEKRVNFDISCDFIDYYHLNKAGATKATEYMSDFILDAMNAS